MTLLWIDGFDHYSAGHMISKGYVDANPYSISNSYSRWGAIGRGVDLTYGDAFRKVLKQPTTELYIGVAVYKNDVDVPSVDPSFSLIEFRDDANSRQASVLIGASYELRAYRGSTLLGQSAPGVVSTTQWFYLEFGVKIHDTLGEVEIRVNEQTVLNLTNVDTKQTSSDFIQFVRAQCIYYNMHTWFDDFYIDDAQFHGNCRVRTFLPDADSGTHAAWTRSGGAADYECVDDAGAPNDDTDYIYTTDKADKSAFGITTGALAGTVKGMQLSSRVKLATAGAGRRIKGLVRSGGADYKSPVSKPLSTVYLYRPNLWLLDPQDGQPWNQTKLEAAEFGLELVDGSTTTTTTSTTSTTTTT